MHTRERSAGSGNLCRLIKRRSVLDGLRTGMALAIALALALPAPAVWAQGQSGPRVPDTKELIAVLDLDAVGASKAETSAIGDRLQDALLKQGKYTLVDRSQIDKLLSEQAFQQSGCTSQECAVRAGRVLGVKKIVTGRVTKINDSTWQISAQLTDVETAETQRAESIPHRGDYFTLLNEVTVVLAERLSGKQGTAVASPAPAVPPAPRPEPPPPVVYTPPPAPEPTGPVAGPVMTILGGTFGMLFGLLASVSVDDAKTARKHNNVTEYKSAKDSYQAEAAISNIGYGIAVLGMIIWAVQAGTQSTARTEDGSGFIVTAPDTPTPAQHYALQAGYRLRW
jgi:hypothetical protein